jgi:hypothetical protein
MHLNGTGKRPVSKQLASEIWNLSATEEILPLLWDGRRYRNK